MVSVSNHHQDHDEQRRKRQKIEDLSELSSSSEEKENINDHGSNVNSIEDAYLETINRFKLDFDFEKICSISLSNVNVYSCLCCGKYFQGRHDSSHAFFHSINDNHHVFINLKTLKFYILPENYEVKDTSQLEDIKYQIEPYYDGGKIKQLYSSKELASDLNHNKYRPGFIGINNINCNDYSNVIIQALSHANKLRDYLLLFKDQDSDDELIRQFSLTVKKIWSSKLFKSHISPHELLQFISKKSNGIFTLAKQKDPKDFLIWLLNNLNQSFFKNKNSKIISKLFQGKVQIESNENEKIDSKISKFWLISLDLPHSSLFKDGAGLTEVPQVSLLTLLNNKFNNEFFQGKRFKILQLPQYLILSINRFDNADSKITGISGSNRNPTVVKFPLMLDMSKYISNNAQDPIAPINYKLIGNVIYELIPSSNTTDEEKNNDKNSWKIQLLDQVRNSWLEIHNLKIREIEKELLFLNESYILIWEKM
ncbi:hypothetical protein PACTADRAFT_36530 [Pachysolen tannophilus NRRL Y-2460]|uniref:UBP-type domain-containing protein n=1 Tax=Pachysolen tannophilus NRRL Y-2460 TaxID=669874 RepID=A0A1E4U1G1_PACTA|nr:hypothetical protein PACTADRAFT_36530 [Pachysolen tannophilus NRRL Y-2460]